MREIKTVGTNRNLPSNVDAVCSYGGTEHECPIRFPRCANCGEDAGCLRCRNQEMFIKCKNCGTLWNAMPWFRERSKPRKESNALAKPGMIRLTPAGFPMIVEGDMWLRACRIDRMPTARKLKLSPTGAYLNEDDKPLFPEDWTA